MQCRPADMEVDSMFVSLSSDGVWAESCLVVIGASRAELVQPASPYGTQALPTSTKTKTHWG